MLNTFGQYWRQAMAGIHRTFGRDPGLRSPVTQFDQQLLTLASDLQTLDGKLEHIRAEAARHGSELLRRIDGLEQTRRENEVSRARDGTRLSDCEQRITGLETGCHQDRETAAALEASVSETLHRLETRNQQIKFLQDSAREQLQAFRTELAETSSRLETNDHATNQRLDHEHQLFLSLENSLTETRGRIDTAEREIATLHQDIAEQRLHIESFLDSATAQLEVANNRATLLEQRLQTDVELKEKQVQQLTLQLQRLEKRLIRVILVGAVALVLLVSRVFLR
jgi:chromosome segregation ATPase